MSDATRRAASRTSGTGRTATAARSTAQTGPDGQTAPANPAAASGMPANGTTADAAAGVAGLVPEAGASRSGEDSRRRGWFWHWNSVVTQYAPLIGLKGVGLLNSYTVWTDRRDESPHRGYAFPSQQSEADFYGEDRAELITINKILVALDLIEIRKEMILKADDRGRQWRVPHNFYRVKDHDDGFSLGARDILKVVELADRDAGVYRYVRRVFSGRFAPIGPDNVWHRLLPELRQDPAWARLAARTAAEEGRASARTRAGHANRKTAVATLEPIHGDDPGPRAVVATPTPANDSGTVEIDGPNTTTVATGNSGSVVDVEESNRGLTPNSATSVGESNDGLPSVDHPSNSGRQTAVAPGNTIYDVPFSTTTTTTTNRAESNQTTDRMDDGFASETMPDDDLRSGTVLAITQPGQADGSTAAGPGIRPAPADGPNEAAAARAFDDANARAATPAERRLLRELATRFDPAAGARGTTGWNWVAAAIYEAVAAGSAFVAPRRIGEILTRWERDGKPESAGTAAAPAPTITSPATSDTRARAAGSVKLSATATGATVAEPGAMSPVQAPRIDPGDLVGDGPDIPLPHGYGSRRTWRFVVGLLGSVLEPGPLAALVAGTAIVGYRDGEVTIATTDALQAERLATTHRDLIARKLGEALRRPVRLAVLAPDPGPLERHADAGSGQVPPDMLTFDAGNAATAGMTAGGTGRERDTEAVGAAELAIPVFPVPECGLGSDQVWATVIAEVVIRGDVSRANVDTWLRATALIGRAEDGGLVVGAGSALAQRRIAGRFLPPLRAAAAAVFGGRVAVDVVVAREWLRANPLEASALFGDVDTERTGA